MRRSLCARKAAESALVVVAARTVGCGRAKTDFDA
jgi:hypothetical protein